MRRESGDPEDGPDFWAWIEAHYRSTLREPSFDTFFLVDRQDGQIVATGSVVPDDRGVGERYAIEGWFAGGIQVRRGYSRSERNLFRLTMDVIEGHVRECTRALRLTVRLNVFGTDYKLFHLLRLSGYTEPTGVGVPHFDTWDQWCCKEFQPFPAKAAPPEHERDRVRVVLFEGRHASTFRRFISGHERLLRFAASFPSLAGDERTAAAAELAAFLSIARFGDLQDQDGELIDRVKYYTAVVARNPAALHIVLGDLPVIVQSRARTRTTTLELGRLAAYSCVLPVTADTYRAFADAEPSRFVVRPPDVVPASHDGGPSAADHVFIEGFWEIVTVNDVMSPRARDELLRHVARFIPPVAFESGGKLLAPKGSGSLPVVFAVARGSLQRSVCESLGFSALPGTPPHAWCRKYVFDFARFNALGREGPAKGQMRLTIAEFGRATEHGTDLRDDAGVD